jgi:uncharacterized protein YgbK (DUF1537 family)
VFLKIDSTLRGPIRGLLAGALAGSRKDIAVIAPAFPEQNRLLNAGRLVLDGVIGPGLSGIIGLDRTAVLSASFTRSAEEVESAVAHAGMRGRQLIIVDADGSDSLRSVAQAWVRHPEWLLVGSAGLARHVAAMTPPPRLVSDNCSGANPGAGPGDDHAPAATDADVAPRGQAAADVWPTAAEASHKPTSQLPSQGPSGQPQSAAAAASKPLPGPILVVAGSPADATRAQLERLESAESPPGIDVVVLATGRTDQRDTGEAARTLAELVAAWALHSRPRAVILAGGATARAVCDQLQVAAVQIVGELAPGIPQGTLRGGIWDGIRVVTKAGAFGTPELFLDVVRTLGVSSTGD